MQVESFLLIVFLKAGFVTIFTDFFLLSGNSAIGSPLIPFGVTRESETKNDHAVENFLFVTRTPCVCPLSYLSLLIVEGVHRECEKNPRKADFRRAQAIRATEITIFTE